VDATGPIKMRWTDEECQQAMERARALHPILSDPRALAERARIFHALGNETRLQILGLLSLQEMCVCNLVAAVGGAASTLAHHLRMLEEAGLIRARQEGKFTLYALNDAPIRQHRAFE